MQHLTEETINVAPIDDSPLPAVVSAVADTPMIDLGLADVDADLKMVLETWDRFVAVKMVTAEAAELKKAEAIQNAITKRMALRKGDEHPTFSKSELDMCPWKKGYADAMRAFAVQDAAYERDKGAWEKSMRTKFSQQATYRQLTPFATIVGRYLLFEEDKEKARRHLVTLMFVENQTNMVKYHNWEVAKSHQSLTYVDTNGSKIARLTVPLFPTETEALDGINENILRMTPEQGETTPFESREIKEMYEWRHNLLLGGSQKNEGGTRKLLEVTFPSGGNILTKIQSVLDQCTDTRDDLELLRAARDAVFRKIKSIEENRGIIFKRKREMSEGSNRETRRWGVQPRRYGDHTQNVSTTIRKFNGGGAEDPKNERTPQQK